MRCARRLRKRSRKRGNARLKYRTACGSKRVNPVSDMTTLNTALQQFEAAEANLEKLDKLWKQIEALLGSGPAFRSPPEYEELCFAFCRILPSLPAIDGFRVEDQLNDYDAIGQMRLDALEIGEVEA